jgi:hypothetical protein
MMNSYAGALRAAVVIDGQHGNSPSLARAGLRFG